AVQQMRGDASVNGTMGVVLSVDKAPGFDTLALTGKIERALTELKSTLPEGVELEIMFRQGDFIRHGIGNLQDAIRDGAIMVTIVLFLFLLNFRTTFISLTAMPLSFAIAVITFRWFGVSVNSMTLGGLAVAIGMVVDDAIVGVENVWRRLRENAALPNPHERFHVLAPPSAAARTLRHRRPALPADRYRHHRLDDRLVHRLGDGRAGALLAAAESQGRQ